MIDICLCSSQNCIKTYVNCVHAQSFVNCTSNTVPYPYSNTMYANCTNTHNVYVYGWSDGRPLLVKRMLD